ncbi:tmRNA [Pseudomonas fluorescens HK44]|uniref:TmRNA n=1 Tax=Pseudomonas fluorescens HK44 TaxID=1042209 RepID=A0A010S7P3_PSEFL|nr:hypothetical protein [Pseudomonas fluorescens]EXF96449.1 tmRNA [Pseudomonas fluorescens HK44]
MKYSVLLGLLVASSMLASPTFAAEKDLCQTNLQTLHNFEAAIESPDMKSQIKATAQHAKAEEAKHTKEGTDNCIALTNQAIQTIKNSDKGGK